MKIFQAPIYQKIVELYKTLHLYRNSIPKQDRYAIWQKCENNTIEILEHLITTAQYTNELKIIELNGLSRKLNTLRVLIRLSKEIKIINITKYICLQGIIDEIGRMTGGWLKSLKQNTPDD